MIPAFIDPLIGTVGSPIDVVTLGYLVYEVRGGVLPRARRTRAAVAAIARETDGVSDDRIVGEMDVDRFEVDALRTDGGDDR